MFVRDHLTRNHQQLTTNHHHHHHHTPAFSSSDHDRKNEPAFITHTHTHTLSLSLSPLANRQHPRLTAPSHTVDHHTSVCKHASHTYHTTHTHTLMEIRQNSRRLGNKNGGTRHHSWKKKKPHNTQCSRIERGKHTNREITHQSCAANRPSFDTASCHTHRQCARNRARTRAWACTHELKRGGDSKQEKKKSGCSHAKNNFHKFLYFEIDAEFISSERLMGV